MRAIVYERYGSPEVLKLKELAAPTPKANELLIKTRVTTVTSGDWRVRSLDVPAGFRLLSRFFFGFTQPRQPILGTELAGDVAAVGKAVGRFRAGDRVFVYTGARMGCYADYVCVAEDGALALQPPNLTAEEAAAISFGGTTALHFLRRGNLRRGERILLNGASGGVGSALLQIAKIFGADVTAVCSTANVELVRSLGADRVIDYTSTDFTTLGETYDLIVDTAGTAPYSRSKRLLRAGGRLLLVFARLQDMLMAPWVAMIGDKRIIAGPASGNGADLRFLAELAEAGDFRPVIDRRFPVERIVEAHRYVDSGRKRGNVVISWT